MICAGNELKQREGMRPRLKRLAARVIVTETELGLFVMAHRARMPQGNGHLKTIRLGQAT